MEIVMRRGAATGSAIYSAKKWDHLPPLTYTYSFLSNNFTIISKYFLIKCVTKKEKCHLSLSLLR